MTKVTYKIYKQPDTYDTHDVRFIVRGEEKGFGFVSQDGDKTIALVRCPICEKENYMMNVLSGWCTWCGFDTKDATPA